MNSGANALDEGKIRTPAELYIDHRADSAKFYLNQSCNRVSTKFVPCFLMRSSGYLRETENLRDESTVEIGRYEAADPRESSEGRNVSSFQESRIE